MRIDYQNLDFIHPKLREMIAEVEKRTGFEFTITSLYRIDDEGVHGQLPVRGMDLRCRAGVFGDPIAKWVNDNYQYDPERPHIRCCTIHDSGHGLHFHFQVHPNTIEVGT